MSPAHLFIEIRNTANPDSQEPPSYQGMEPFVSYAEAWRLVTSAVMAWQAGFETAHGSVVPDWELRAEASIRMGNGTRQLPIQLGTVEAGSGRPWLLEGLHGEGHFQAGDEGKLNDVRYVMATSAHDVDAKLSQHSSFADQPPEPWLQRPFPPAANQLRGEVMRNSETFKFVGFTVLDLATGEETHHVEMLNPSEPPCVDELGHCWRELAPQEMDVFLPASDESDTGNPDWVWMGKKAECCLLCGRIRESKVLMDTGETAFEYKHADIGSDLWSQWFSAHWEASPPSYERLKARVVRGGDSIAHPDQIGTENDYRGLANALVEMSQAIARDCAESDTQPDNGTLWGLQVSVPRVQQWTTVASGVWDPVAQKPEVRGDMLPYSHYRVVHAVEDGNHTECIGDVGVNPLEHPVTWNGDSFFAWSEEAEKEAVSGGRMTVFNLLTGEAMKGTPALSKWEPILPSTQEEQEPLPSDAKADEPRMAGML